MDNHKKEDEKKERSLDDNTISKKTERKTMKTHVGILF